MAINADLARVGVTGAGFVAPLATALPAALAVPGTGWVDLGAISEEGLTETRSEDRVEFTPWQSTSPIRTEVTSTTKAFTFTCWESSAAVNSLYYQTPIASMTTATGVVSFDEAARPVQDIRAFIFDIFDGTNQRRFILPRAEVTERGDIQYASGNMIGYPLTVTALPGTDGISIRRLFKEGWTTP
jgi:hypothetical protein